MYINDIPERVKSQLRLLADDSYLYRRISGEQDTVHLQEDHDELIKWEKEWSTEFHPDKCKLRNQIEADYCTHNQILDTVDTAKYLGVLLNKKLSWKQQVDAICKKANKTRAFLQCNLKGCPRDVKSQSYNTYVRPIVEYASVVWDPVGEGNQQLNYQVEIVQCCAARFMTGDWRVTIIVSATIKQLGWETLDTRRQQSKLLFMHKYCHEIVDIPETIATRARGENISFQAINSIL